MSVRELVPTDAAAGMKFCIVAAQWNETIVQRLLAGALGALRGCGAADDDIDVRWVPGSFELPQAARFAAAVRVIDPRRDREWHPDAVIALGCIIRGETEHFRLVADAAAQGLLRVALDTGVPVLNGVLAVEDVAQAESRSGGEHGNAGAQAALAAVHMVNLFDFKGRP
jgi:6,7-dimethyl-8-ribityllumazine synthase